MKKYAKSLVNSLFVLEGDRYEVVRGGWWARLTDDGIFIQGEHRNGDRDSRCDHMIGEKWQISDNKEDLI